MRRTRSRGREEAVGRAAGRTLDARGRPFGRAMLAVVALAATVVASACEPDGVLVDPGPDFPAAPRSFDAWYHAGAVHLTWELASGWDGEPFRVYGKRSSDAGWFLVAEVTNCIAGACSYTDVNVRSGQTYDYYVAAVGPWGDETASDYSVSVYVPVPVPPAVPGALDVVALDGANYLVWDDAARGDSDFSHYRVWLRTDGTDYLLGETDSEGFLDLLAENGLTYRYFVTAVDEQGHESTASGMAEGTPRPDYHNEWLWDFYGLPDASGFRFQADESSYPVVSGTDPRRHFRLETDEEGWWLVPGPEAAAYPQGFETTALKCGVAADAECIALEVAPASGYVTSDVYLHPQTTYVLRVRGDDGKQRYGAVRVQLLGYDQDGVPIAIFDWSYQLQPGNPDLTPRPAGVGSPSGSRAR